MKSIHVRADGVACVADRLVIRRAVMRLFCPLVLGATMGGCVFREIRDEIRTSNAQLRGVEGELTSTNAAIGRTNEVLKDVETGLGRLDATNVSLSDMQERLSLLRSIEESLRRMDVHLASLRKTISQIDSMIPFVDLGGDVVETPVETAPAAAVVQAEGEVDAATSASSPPATASTPKRDALIGAWVSEYPDRSTALVMLEDGRYIRQVTAGAGGGTPTEAGAWKREGVWLKMTPTPSAAEPSGAKAAGAKPAAPAVPMEYSLEIITRSVKSMTLRAADGRLAVYSKP
ncbi:MAG: hypothetical protein JNK58_13025 [Phycisphaerae bacterium]|nr:hypothetical protein [Phycisphaerae bacterium]